MLHNKLLTSTDKFTILSSLYYKPYHFVYDLVHIEAELHVACAAKMVNSDRCGIHSVGCHLGFGFEGFTDFTMEMVSRTREIKDV